MNNKEFDKFAKGVLEGCYALLCSKQKEYSSNKDRLSGFKIEWLEDRNMPPAVLLGFLLKHFNSINTMITEQYIDFDIKFKFEKWQEKCYDIINYMVLLLALIIEDYGADLNENN